MRLLVVIAALLGACASAPPRYADPATFTEAVASGALDASSYDFAAADFWRHSAETRAAWSASIKQVYDGPEGTPRSCDQRQLNLASARAWVGIAAAAPDAETWRAEASALRQQTHRLDALIEARINGTVLEPETGLGSTQRDLAEATDARVVELLHRVIREQSWRLAYRGTWKDELPSLAADQWGNLVSGRLIPIDCENTAWLRAQLAEIGWFDLPSYGRAADGAAWLLTQHADRTPEFQRAVLATLEALPPGHTNPGNTAYLWDRVAVAERRPQRFGTQVECASGVRRPILGLEDAENVEARRAEAGLPTLTSYIERMNSVFPCPPA